MVPADSSICFGCRPPSQAAHAAQSFSEHSPLEVWGRKRGAGREKDGCLLFVIGGSSTDGTLGCGRKEDKHLSSRLPEIIPIPEVVKDEKDVLASLAKGVIWEGGGGKAPHMGPTSCGHTTQKSAKSVELSDD